MSAVEPAPRRAWPHRIGLVLLVISAVGVIAVACAVPQFAALGGPGSPSRPLYAEPGPGADPTTEAEAGETAPPVPGQPLRLVIPAAGLDVTVGSMATPYNGRIDPPTPGSAYWIKDYGLTGPSSGETAYIAGHTFRGDGTAVFNSLFDRSTRNAVVAIGDVLDVQTLDSVYRYTITAVARYDKATVEQQQELWQNVPGRLVIVACQYNGDESSTQNLVLYAEFDAVTSGAGAPGGH